MESTGGGALLTICRILLLLLVSGFNGMSARASYLKTAETECRDVDLRSVFDVRIRNQGEISWCYANAAADYLQYLYRIPEQISAADIAIRYAGTDASKVLEFFKRMLSRGARNSPPETGFLALAVKKSIPEGWCPESYLPSFQWTRVDVSSGRKEPQDIMKSIVETYRLQKDIRSGRYGASADLPVFFEFPQIDQEGFFQILKNSSRSRVLSEIRAHACKGARRPYAAGARAEMNLTGRKVFKRLNAALNRREPVSIDFFSGILEHLDGYRRNLMDLHTVLIYGRRFDPETGECRYLMKNSYGTGCSRYDPRIPCDSGYLWFTEKQLFPVITSVVQVRRAP
jgi:hypothetical protein